MFRPVASILLVVLVLASTVGIPVYTHVCHGRAEQWSSAIFMVKKCCSEQQHAAGIKAGKVRIGPLPCCEDHTSVAALDTDFLQNVHGVVQQLIAVAPALAIIPEFGIFGIEEWVSAAKKGYEAHAPPLLLWGRGLLIYKQVFRL